MGEMFHELARQKEVPMNMLYGHIFASKNKKIIVSSNCDFLKLLIFLFGRQNLLSSLNQKSVPGVLKLVDVHSFFSII